VETSATACGKDRIVDWNMEMAKGLRWRNVWRMLKVAVTVAIHSGAYPAPPLAAVVCCPDQSLPSMDCIAAFPVNGKTGLDDHRSSSPDCSSGRPIPRVAFNHTTFCPCNSQKEVLASSNSPLTSISSYHSIIPSNKTKQENKQ
jgi:hypothetical protein